MPCYKEHQEFGGFVGATTSCGFAVAANLPPLLVFAESLGGYVAGKSAGTWADCMDLPTSSHHRDTAHALLPVAAGSKYLFDQVPSMQASLRSSAQLCFQNANMSTNGLEQFINVALGLVLHVAAGAVPAIPASYISHIALDAATPRGVPLLTRGF
jgi:hypothetical protein